MEFIRSLNPSLLRVARMFVPTAALAEDVVQETWLAVLNGIDRFEGRSSLKTWIFRILTNTAKTRGERERRSVPFSALDTEQGGFEPAVERSRFDAHLSGCDGCTAYVEQMRRTIELTGRLRVDDVSLEAEEALRRAFRDWKAR